MRPLLLFATLLLAVVSTPLYAVNEKFLTIGTADELGVYYPTGGAICRLLKRGIKDHGIRCFVESTSGSVFNLDAIRNHKIDIGIVQSDLVYNAYNGTEEFDGESFNSNLRTLLSMHMEALTVLVREDSKIQRFADIRSSRYSVGEIGTGVVATMERLAKQEGRKRFFDASHKASNAQEQMKALCAGRMDVVMYMAGHPNGAFTEATNLCKTRIIPVEGEDIDKLLAKYPFYYKTVIPGGMYPGNASSIPTIATKALLVSSTDLPADEAYEVVKAVMGNLDNFKTLHPVFATLDKDKMANEGFVAPAHEGSLRYFKENHLQ